MNKVWSCVGGQSLAAALTYSSLISPQECHPQLLLNSCQLVMLSWLEDFITLITMLLRGVQQGLGLLLNYWGVEMQVSQTVQDFNPGFPGFSLTKHDKKGHKNKLFIHLAQPNYYNLLNIQFFPFVSRRVNYLSSSIYNLSISKIRT